MLHYTLTKQSREHKPLLVKNCYLVLLATHYGKVLYIIHKLCRKLLHDDTYRIRENFGGQKVSQLYELKTVRVKMFAFARKPLL